MKLNKKVRRLVLICMILMLVGGIYCCYTLDKHIVECKTDNFFFLYGTIENDNSCILLKPSDKLTENEKASLTDENIDSLVMVSDVISEEARANYIPSDKGIDIYGKQNVYVISQGIGIFNHTYEKTMDVLYLTDNTAIKLGLKEGQLQETQDYLEYLDEVNKASNSEAESKSDVTDDELNSEVGDVNEE